jgi:hypothetical protein
LLDVGKDGVRGQGDARLGVDGDRLEPLERAIKARRIGRDGHDAGVEAAEKGGDIVEAWGEQQQRPLAGDAVGLQPGGDAARPAIQLGIG